MRVTKKGDLKLVLVLFLLLLESLTFTPEFTNDDGKSFGVSALLAKPDAKGQSFSVETCNEIFLCSYNVFCFGAKYIYSKVYKEIVHQT